MDSIYDDDNLAPVMQAIDAVQLLIEEEKRTKAARDKRPKRKLIDNSVSEQNIIPSTSKELPRVDNSSQKITFKHQNDSGKKPSNPAVHMSMAPQESRETDQNPQKSRNASLSEIPDDFDSRLVRNHPLMNLIEAPQTSKPEEYEFIPKSVILDVYSNDPEVKRFLKQLPKIANEFGYNEQDYKCYSCRRPIGMVFGQSRLCHFDGHHYCSECHLAEKSTVPARILCNWDFNKYPISKRNLHFLTLISNEPMFELKTIAPLLYKACPELREIEELRCQAFFIRSYCFTCVQDSVSFELTKLVWPREHLIKQTDLYSLEDLTQLKSGALKSVLKNVITFGRQHVLSCVLCCQKGFICELCKSSQIIYPFDTESVYRCAECQSIFHKTCYNNISSSKNCPRCERLKARRCDN